VGKVFTTIEPMTRGAFASSPRDVRNGPSVLDWQGLRGLTVDEAAERLEREGPNELPSKRERTLYRIALEVAREPMFLMLVAAGASYALMGEATDATMLLGFVVVVMGITIVQERRTERALDALRDLASPRALVLRGGEPRRIPGRDVVRGDLIVLAEGDRIPADGLLRRGLHLGADESLLTGESVPVRKAPSLDATSLDAPGGDDLPSVFSGTLVTSGQGVMEVLATGGASKLGSIGRALAAVESEPTPLQRETGRLVATFARIGLAACAVVVVAYALTRGGGPRAWRDGLLAGIAMAMATLPEELPVILTVFLALGARRLGASRVLTRRMPAVETLGSATVLCVDKTGTMTANRMVLRELATEGLPIDLTSREDEAPEDVHALLEFAILASKRDPFDPMERALHEAGEAWLGDTEHLHPTWRLEREYPLEPALLAVSHAWRAADQATAVVASKGAPEAIADLCHLSEEARAKLEARVDHLAGRGLRVLAVARGEASIPALPERHHDLKLELVGLLGFEDPLRAEVPEAVAECRAAGLRVVMITGDYPETAASIARQAGLADAPKLLTGPELAAMSDDELAAAIGTLDVFARVVPEQKLRIVRALKAQGEVVAMTGDGVNDAPALKAAHIGIAMGGRGTDVAREAAALVLLDDDFGSIVGAVRLGRRIFDNIKKAIAFVFAVHVPIVGLSMIPVFVPDWPLLLLPVHIVFLELVIDPSCSLIFEAELAEPDVMQRPPRSNEDRLFDGPSLRLAIAQGVAVLLACLALFILARGRHGADGARALTFTTLVAAFLAIILVNRSWSRSLIAMVRVPNAAFRWIVGGTSAFLLLALGLPAARRVFHFAPVDAVEAAFAVGLGLTSVLVFEVRKLHRTNPRTEARASKR
jgi:Ca2+-transporting ATPase